MQSAILRKTSDRETSNKNVVISEDNASVALEGTLRGITAIHAKVGSAKGLLASAVPIAARLSAATLAASETTVADRSEAAAGKARPAQQPSKTMAEFSSDFEDDRFSSFTSSGSEDISDQLHLQHAAANIVTETPPPESSVPPPPPRPGSVRPPPRPGSARPPLPASQGSARLPPPPRPGSAMPLPPPPIGSAMPLPPPPTGSAGPPPVSAMSPPPVSATWAPPPPSPPVVEQFYAERYVARDIAATLPDSASVQQATSASTPVHARHMKASFSPPAVATPSGTKYAAKSSSARPQFGRSVRSIESSMARHSAPPPAPPAEFETTFAVGYEASATRRGSPSPPPSSSTEVLQVSRASSAAAELRGFKQLFGPSLPKAKTKKKRMVEEDLLCLDDMLLSSTGSPPTEQMRSQLTSDDAVVSQAGESSTFRN